MPLCGCPAGSWWRTCPRSSRRRPSCLCTGRRRPRCRRRGCCTRSGSGPAWWPSGCRRSGRCASGCRSPPSTLPATKQLLTRWSPPGTVSQGTSPFTGSLAAKNILRGRARCLPLGSESHLLQLGWAEVKVVGGVLLLQGDLEGVVASRRVGGVVPLRATQQRLQPPLCSAHAADDDNQPCSGCDHQARHGDWSGGAGHGRTLSRSSSGLAAVQVP